MNPVHLEKAVALRHELHAHPALSLEEAPTMARLIAFLREHTTLEIVERGAWFYALYRTGEGAESSASSEAYAHSRSSMRGQEKNSPCGPHTLPPCRL